MIIEKIGKGGNGQVYKVKDLRLEKEWAMKILENNYVLQSDEEWEELMDEGQILKKLSHPNFPRIVDAFEEEKKTILVMDYIQGITLEEIIRKAPLEEKQILHLGKQIAEAILYLHQYTPVLLYLDLKPSNLIVDEKGSVKLVDLGSVMIKGTKGLVSGSFGFSSPEQRKLRKGGSLLKEQSDIFSFGMVLYVMAVGNCNRIPVVEEKQRRGIFAGKDNPFVSRPLDKVIEKCTRGNPAKRYSSMREVLKELEICEKMLRRRKVFGKKGIVVRNKNTQWYQEKSIFCTEGKHSFYIAKKY